MLLARVNKATPPAPDTLLGSAEILNTYRGKNYPSKKKANTDLLINYLQGVLLHLQRWIKKGGGWVVPKLWKEVVGA